MLDEFLFVAGSDRCRLEVLIDNRSTHAEGLGDLRRFETLLPKLQRSVGVSFGRSRFASVIAVGTTDFGSGDTGGLASAGVFEFHFGDTEQYRRDDATDGSVQIQLLRDADDPYATLTPISERVHAIALISREAIELPDDDGFDLAMKDRRFQFGEAGSVERLTGFKIFEPSDLAFFDALSFEPSFDFLLLAVEVLPIARHSHIARDSL